MLTIATVESILRTLNLEFNLWGADPRDNQVVGLWQARLRQCGLTEENAARMIGAFCGAWIGRKVVLHDVAVYVQGRVRLGKGRESRKRPAIYASRPDGTQTEVKADPWKEEHDG